MVILSKKTSIMLSILISTTQGQQRLKVEINDSDVIFRAYSVRTEVTLHQARLYPARMSNAVQSLIGGSVYDYELERLVQELLPLIGDR